ncbi:MAG: hypothetical protein HN576_14665 [Bacteriovoracaceae bacterium]|jgi:hypothetical protein|nr:hypothetical protein [Bacteriovoracaceae bacterium]
MVLMIAYIKILLILLTISFLSICNKIEFYQKEFLIGVGVNIDQEIEDKKILCANVETNNQLDIPSSKIVELSTVSELLEGSGYSRSEINLCFFSHS